MGESGEKKAINRNSSPPEVLNEVELQSYQAAREGDRTHRGTWDYAAEVSPWGNIGCGGVDFYWTLRSDGCRYEYWSTDPGDNEYGILVCVDYASMRAIGMGNDDGLGLFDEFEEEFGNNAAFIQLLKEGWPRFKSDESDSDEEEEESDSDEEEEESDS